MTPTPTARHPPRAAAPATPRRGRVRGIPLTVGLVALAAAWSPPLVRLVPGSFAAHMTMHVAVVAVAAPLVAVGLAGTRLDPTRRGPTPLSGVLGPIPLSLLELLVVWGWHAPLPHHVARSSLGGLAVEQASFLVVGTLLWLASIPGRDDEPAERSRIGAGVVGLLFTSMHMTLLGALLGLAQRSLYPGHEAPAAAAGALGLLEDQQAGGAIMLLVGAASYLAGGLWLTAKLVRAGATSSTAASGEAPS